MLTEQPNHRYLHAKAPARSSRQHFRRSTKTPTNARAPARSYRRHFARAPARSSRRHLGARSHHQRHLPTRESSHLPCRGPHGAPHGYVTRRASAPIMVPRHTPSLRHLLVHTCSPQEEIRGGYKVNKEVNRSGKSYSKYGRLKTDSSSSTTPPRCMASWPHSSQRNASTTQPTTAGT